MYELSPNGTGGYNFTTLYSFSGSDGRSPEGGLIMDSNGNLYGTTTQGGASNDGTVYELSPNGTGGYNFTTLHSFSGSDGETPFRNLMMDGQGNLYGVTLYGGTSNDGTVYEISSSGTTFTDLYNFSLSAGTQPDGTLLMDSKRDLYGITAYGGTSNDGTVFELSPNGTGDYTLTTLHSFTGSDGSIPDTGLTADSNGNLYGVTAVGGSYNSGTIFEITGAFIPATTTTASNATAPFSPNAQNVTLTADVTSSSGPVNEGTVTFTLLQGTTVIGTATTSTTVSDGEASVRYALPAALAAGASLTIDAVYNPGPDFSGSSDETHTLTINPAQALTTATGLTAYYSAVSQPLTLSADVNDDSIPTDVVNEGVVTFTIMKGMTTIGSIAAGVSAGMASIPWTLPAGEPPGNYTIDVGYVDASGNFIDSGDNSASLIVSPANVAANANNVSAAYSPNTQTLTLSAALTDLSAPLNGVDEGIVTFTVKKGTTTLGTVQGNVSNSTANAAFTLPAEEPPGSYAIDVSYSDSLGNYVADTETNGTLTITPASVTTTASNASTGYRVNSQTVKLSAAVADVSIPTDTVNEGVVTFTVMSGNDTVGSFQSLVSNGTAYAYLTLPSGQAPGSYAIDVSYSDGSGDFTDSGDTPATLTISPASVTTIASNSSATYRPNSQTLSLSALVNDASVPTDLVGEGVVIFTIMNGTTPVSSAQGTVSNGVATANVALPAGQAAGSYTIDVSYSDASGNFTDDGDTSAMLTIAPAEVVTTTLASVITFSTAAQTVSLNATIADDSLPQDIVGEGAVTFTIKNGQTIIGNATGSVSDGTASADFTWSAGRPAGSYTIAVSYADSQGNFTDSGDTSSTLTVSPALVAASAVNASAVYSPNAENVTLYANVAGPGAPSGTLDAGAVVFTIENGSAVVGTAQGEVSGGTAFANFALPAGLAAGNYTIDVHYTDINGNFSDSGDVSATLTIAPANVVTTANNASFVAPNVQSMTLSAAVANSSNSGNTVGEGTVTFTVMNGTSVIGTPVQGAVSNGMASANFNVPTGMAAGSYTIDVGYTDANGNFSDNGDISGTLSVLLAPSVTANPIGETVPTGGTAIFTAAANGNPAPTVQWQVSSDGGNTFTNISDATSTTLTLNDVQASQNGLEYQAVFTNSIGTTTTSAATLIVSLAPTITTNPISQTVTAGSNVTLTASANGGPPPTVQWQVSTDGGKTFSDISGAISTTLTLNDVQASQNGLEYQAVFTNSIGTTTTSAATLTVQYAPTVTLNPSNQGAIAGQEVTFTAAANSNPAATVQWQVSSDGGNTFTNISGATTTTLTLAGLTTAMSGYEYQAVFTNSMGDSTTSAATLTISAGAVPAITSNPNSQTASAGATVSFTASANGSQTPTVQWQVSTNGGATFSNINGATNPTLILTDVTSAMNGYRYQAVFSNSVGDAISNVVTLSVAGSSSSSPSSLVLNVPPLLALIDQLIEGIETVNANGTETVVYSWLGFPLVSANYDGLGNFLDATLFGLSIPNWIWFV